MRSHGAFQTENPIWGYAQPGRDDKYIHNMEGAFPDGTTRIFLENFFSENFFQTFGWATVRPQKTLKKGGYE
jgi:hypothetical protein